MRDSGIKSEGQTNILEIAPLYGCMQFETLFQNIDFNLYCIICLGHKITSKVLSTSSPGHCF